MQTPPTITLQAKGDFVLEKKSCPRQQSEDVVSVNLIQLLLWTLDFTINYRLLRLDYRI